MFGTMNQFKLLQTNVIISILRYVFFTFVIRCLWLIFKF